MLAHSGQTAAVFSLAPFLLANRAELAQIEWLARRYYYGVPLAEGDGEVRRRGAVGAAGAEVFKLGAIARW